jgi:hypothetical protein
MNSRFTTGAIKQPKELTLHKALKLSYLDNNKKKKKLLKKYGYRLDESLSNHNQTVGYNAHSKKLLMATAGTHNYDDAKTDLQLAFGNLKRTKRYNEAKETLNRANEKYKGRQNTLLTGESLGGTITGYLPYDKNTRAFAVNSGYTIGQETRDRDGRLTNYRVKGDIISGLSSGHQFQNTLDLNVPKRGKNKTEQFFNEAYDRHVHRLKNTGIKI